MAASLTVHLAVLFTWGNTGHPAARVMPEKFVTVQLQAKTHSIRPSPAPLAKSTRFHRALTPYLPKKTHASAPTDTIASEGKDVWPSIDNAIPYPVGGIDMSEESDLPGGRARFQLDVGRNGQVVTATLLESTLDQPGSERLRQKILATHFVPAVQNGVAIEAKTMLEVTFGIAPPPSARTLMANE